MTHGRASPHKNHILEISENSKDKHDNQYLQKKCENMQPWYKHDISPHTNFPLAKCEIELCVLCLSHTLDLIDTVCPRYK